MGGAGLPAGLTRQVVGLFRKGPFAPVEQAIGARVGTVQVVGASRERLPIEPDRPFLRGTVAIAIVELQNLRRHGNIDRTLMPEHAFWKAKAFRKDHAAVENPIAIRVLQPQQPVRSLRPLHFRRLIRTRDLCHIKPSAVVEARLHWTLHEATGDCRSNRPAICREDIPRNREDPSRREHEAGTNRKPSHPRLQHHTPCPSTAQPPG